MKLSKAIFKSLIGILSVTWTLGVQAQEVNCTQPSQTDILRIMGTPFFTSLTEQQKVEFLENLKQLGIDVDDSLFEFIDIDAFEMQSGEKPSTILTKPK